MSCFKERRDAHVIELECCFCGEPIRFTQNAKSETIDRELQAHRCAARTESEVNRGTGRRDGLSV
jgi:hypothetical protein